MFGVCKLCLEEKRLVDSHLLPAFLYRLCREPGAGTNPNPIALTAKIAISTSKQMKGYLLCRDCEHRFHVHGENWVARQVYNGTVFPLLDRLSSSSAASKTEELAIYDGNALGVETGTIAYFALSVLWRAAVRKWEMIDRERISVDLGEYEEAIRRFLLGGAFPAGVVVMTIVCTDEISRASFCSPSRKLGPRDEYSFFTRGLAFNIFIGSNLPEEVRMFCWASSPYKALFVASYEDKVFRAGARLRATARPLVKR